MWSDRSCNGVSISGLPSTREMELLKRVQQRVTEMIKGLAVLKPCSLCTCCTLSCSSYVAITAVSPLGSSCVVRLLSGMFKSAL